MAYANHSTVAPGSAPAFLLGVPYTHHADPLIPAIETYEAGLAEFYSGIGPRAGETDDEFSARTLEGPGSVIVEWNKPAKTYIGAVGALYLALMEQERAGHMQCAWTVAMIRAALGYLDPSNSLGKLP